MADTGAVQALRMKRVKDTVAILSKLQEVGIAPTEPGYVAVKSHMDAWVRAAAAADPTEACGEFKIPFPRAGRVGELVLPRRIDRTASLMLKVVDGRRR